MIRRRKGNGRAYEYSFRWRSRGIEMRKVKRGKYVVGREVGEWSRGNRWMISDMIG